MLLKLSFPEGSHKLEAGRESAMREEKKGKEKREKWGMEAEVGEMKRLREEDLIMRATEAAIGVQVERDPTKEGIKSKGTE